MSKVSALALALVCGSSLLAGGCLPEDTDETGAGTELGDEEASAGEEVGTDQEELFGGPRSFDVEFTDCVDTAGITPIPRTNAQSLVPAGLTLAGSGDTVPFVVRVASCKGVAVEGRFPAPATVVQVGVTIVAPDGNTANLNNYTGWYYTDNLRLALRLQLVGMNAQWVPLLKHKYTQNAARTGGTLEIKVPGNPSLNINGQVNEPTVAPTVYEANWWQQGDRGLIQLDTILPAIAFGTAPVLGMTTPAHSAIADLTGATNITFTSFHSFSRSTPEHMHVSVSD